MVLLKKTLFFIIAAVTLSGCYTQLQTSSYSKSNNSEAYADQVSNNDVYREDAVYNLGRYGFNHRRHNFGLGPLYRPYYSTFYSPYSFNSFIHCFSCFRHSFLIPSFTQHGLHHVHFVNNTGHFSNSDKVFGIRASGMHRSGIRTRSDLRRPDNSRMRSSKSVNKRTVRRSKSSSRIKSSGSKSRSKSRVRRSGTRSGRSGGGSVGSSSRTRKSSGGRSRSGGSSRSRSGGSQ